MPVLLATREGTQLVPPPGLCKGNGPLNASPYSKALNLKSEPEIDLSFAHFSLVADVGTASSGGFVFISALFVGFETPPVL